MGIALEEGAGSENGASALTEYKIYVDLLLKPLSLDVMRQAICKQGSGRRALELCLEQFIQQLRPFVPGCDDRKLSRACLRRAQRIEQQILQLGEQLFSAEFLGSLLTPDDLHGIWHGFVAMRGWRDGRVPQDCLLTFLSGILNELDDDLLEDWKQHALQVELPLVQGSISVSAWPGLCQHLGELPPCVTAQELRETLWQQAFVENPTRAPGHRNFRRFALLSAQMVAIGVELESEKVELLVRQVLNLDRPWRERRDMLSGILTAASVVDRRKVVENLDRRFEQHAEIDDFEIVCGIAEHIGVEIPPDGAIRRCALRRWALDTKRGGALPVSRLSDFVDRDVAIGEDVACSLRQRGRVADAALLLSKLPNERSGEDVELDRLQEILSLADDGAFHADDGAFPFGPVDSQGFLLPHDNFLGACETAEAADAALERLREEDLLVIHLFREEAPFWHRPGSVLVVGSSQHVELFDLFALRAEETDGTELVNWPLLAQKLRGILSQQDVLKIVWGGIEELIDMAIELGLGIARSLKPNEKDPVGPVLDSQSLLQELFPGSGWPSIFRRVLGLRLCLEEEGSNWSRRPLRRSQLHHAAVMTWTQLPVLHALCAKTSLLPEAKLRGHVCVQSRTRFWLRSRDGGKHVLGQLAPPGRMVEPKGARGTASSFTRVALLEDSENQEEVEVVSDLIGNSAMVVPLGADLATPRRVDARCLRAVNCWSSSVWVERLMAAASVDRGEEFFGTVDQLAVAEVMPAFTSRLAMSTTTRTLAGIHQSRRGCKQRQEICWKLCSRFFDLDLANGLLEQSYAAQRSLLGDPWES